MDRVPSFVSDKFDALTETRDALRAWATASMQRADTARERVAGLRLELASRRGSGGMSMVGPGGELPPEIVAEMHERIAELEAKIAGHVAEFSRRKVFADAADHSCNHARDFIARLANDAMLAPLAAVPINGDPKRLLEIVRRDLGEVRGRLSRLRSLPPLLAEVEASIRAWVDAKARAQKLVVRLPRGKPLEVGFDVSSVLGPSSARADPLVLACKLDPEGMSELLLSEAKRNPLAAEGIDDDAFEAEEEKLTAKIAELAWIEENIVSALQAESPSSCTRRSDADPSIILGIKTVAKHTVRAAA